MSSETSPYVSPQDKLNQQIMDPQANEGVDFRAQVAKDVFAASMGHLAANINGVTQDMVKYQAVIAVDAADQLIAQLTKGRRLGK